MRLIILFPILISGLFLPCSFVDAPGGQGFSVLSQSTGVSRGILQTDSKDETGLTSLMQAVQDDNLQEVQLLFLKWANPNANDVFGWTALMYALKPVNMGIIMTLLEHGADINAKDNRGINVLMWAVLTGKADLIKLLLARGADVNATDNRGATALSFALAAGHNKIAQLIKAAGGNGPEVTKASVPKQIAPIDELPQLIKPVYPEYPKEASELGIQGAVHLHILVRKDGTIGEIRVDRGLSYGLTESAVRAASKLVMKPGKNNGQAVDYWIPVQMEFSKKSL